jgi:hypothetical protein
MKIISLITGEQLNGVPFHASTHHEDGLDAISAEAIGARSIEVDIDWEEIENKPEILNASWTWATGWYVRYPGAYGFDIRLNSLSKQVFFGGLVGRSGGDSLLIGTLGVGFRPTRRRLFLTTMRQLPTDSIKLARIGIFNNGEVVLEVDNQNPLTYQYSNGTIDWVALDPINFFTTLSA